MAVYAFTCCHFRVFLNIRPLVTNPNTHYGPILVLFSPQKLGTHSYFSQLMEKIFTLEYQDNY